MTAYFAVLNFSIKEIKVLVGMPATVSTFIFLPLSSVFSALMTSGSCVISAGMMVGSFPSGAAFSFALASGAPRKIS
jgi:hypothetical protein